MIGDEIRDLFLPFTCDLSCNGPEMIHITTNMPSKDFPAVAELINKLFPDGGPLFSISSTGVTPTMGGKEKDLSIMFPSVLPHVGNERFYPSSKYRNLDFTVHVPQIPGTPSSVGYFQETSAIKPSECIAPTPRYDQTTEQNYDVLKESHQKQSKIIGELRDENIRLNTENTRLTREHDLDRSTLKFPEEDALVRSADRAFRFFAGVRMETHPISEQREYIAVMADLGKRLREVLGNCASDGSIVDMSVAILRKMNEHASKKLSTK